jgi:hypothetical protein
MTQALRATSVLFGMLCASSLSTVFAQGSDSCASAQALVGSGQFAFDTTSATTGSEGQGESACFFRDASAAFCPAPPGNTWDVSGGLKINW